MRCQTDTERYRGGEGALGTDVERRNEGAENI